MLNVYRKNIVSINKRDIFDVALDPYTIRCNKCGTENKKQIRCLNSKCGNLLQFSHKTGGVRPVLVISSPVSNPINWGDEIVLTVPITTKTAHVYEFPNTVLLPAGGETGLDVPSLAMVFNVLSIDRANFYEKNRRGKIGDGDWTKVESRLRTVMEIDKEKLFFGDKEITPDQAKTIMKGYLDCRNNHSNYDKLKNAAQDLKRDYEKRIQEFYQEKGKEFKNQTKEIKKLNSQVSELNDKLEECEKKQKSSTLP